MEMIDLIAKAGFYITLAVTLGAALMVVTLRNIFHCALSLVLTLLGVAAIYVSLRAEFFAVVQILIYVGAIMTLVIFAIMLTSHIGDKTVKQNNGQSLAALVVLGVFNFFFIGTVMSTRWINNVRTYAANVDARSLGLALMKDYVFPFEIISVVLIVALVGAIMLGRSDE